MNGMRGLNGAARPHLFTEETRLANAIEFARTNYPHNGCAFRSWISGATGMPHAHTETYWRLWRAERDALPLEHVTMWTEGTGVARHSSR